MVAVDHGRCGCRKMENNNGVNAAILERIEKVVQS